MQSRHVRKLRDEKAARPGAANIRLKALRALFRWAVEAEEVSSDPARDVRLIRYPTTGFHSWSIEEVAKFEATYPVGTKSRLALSLLLYTACRREDVVRLGPQHGFSGIGGGPFYGTGYYGGGGFGLVVVVLLILLLLGKL
jgi:integrase/recombinase XerD